MKKVQTIAYKIILILVLLATLTACVPQGNGNLQNDSEEINVNKKLYIYIKDSVLRATLENNSSANALVELLQKADLTIDMNDYASFEKVGDIGTTLPRNDKQITTQAGDLILYMGRYFVIYYDTNAYSLTRLGKLDNISQIQLKSILGSGDVTIRLSLNAPK